MKLDTPYGSGVPVEAPYTRTVNSIKAVYLVGDNYYFNLIVVVR